MTTERIRARERKRYADNLEKHRAKNRRTYQQIKARNPGWLRQRADSHKALRWKTKGYPTPTRPCPQLCECCGNPPGRKALALDHDHVTGKFRGWLCGACNPAIGSLGDNYDGVLRALDYLLRNG